jgi:hypothetical protein
VPNSHWYEYNYNKIDKTYIHMFTHSTSSSHSRQQLHMRVYHGQWIHWILKLIAHNSKLNKLSLKCKIKKRVTNVNPTFMDESFNHSLLTTCEPYFQAEMFFITCNQETYSEIKYRMRKYKYFGQRSKQVWTTKSSMWCNLRNEMTGSACATSTWSTPPPPPRNAVVSVFRFEQGKQKESKH